MLSCKEGRIVLGLMDMPVPNNEAEKNAAYNYMWKDAVEQTRKHKAHLLLSVLGSATARERGELFAKVAASCCKQENVLGLYANGVVYEPKFYILSAEMMKEELFPLLNLIWLGLRTSEQGINAYTIGMKCFGKDEMEVINAPASAGEVRDFLMDMVSYVIEEDVVLRNGETIGFSAEQKLAIRRNPGVSIDGMSLKIEYGKVG